jgi:hypothetical protein
LSGVTTFSTVKLSDVEAEEDCKFATDGALVESVSNFAGTVEFGSKTSV